MTEQGVFDVKARPHERFKPRRPVSAPCCPMEVLSLARPTPLFTATMHRIHCTTTEIYSAVYGHTASPVMAWVHQKLPEQLMLGSTRDAEHAIQHKRLNHLKHLATHCGNTRVNRTALVVSLGCRLGSCRQLYMALRLLPRHEAQHRELCTVIMSCVLLRLVGTERRALHAGFCRSCMSHRIMPRACRHKVGHR